MAFHERLEAHAGAVERHLDFWLNEARLGFVPGKLLDAMRYGCLGGGKRLRPFLVLESARLFGIDEKQALNAAIALECIHCYSLIHDDLPAMDDDDLRRGRPTVHKAFDEATAILAGDALLTLAFEICTTLETHSDAGVRAALALNLAKASGAAGMAGGQMYDLDASGKTLTEKDVQTLQRMKTGALIVFACEAGALLGQASPSDCEALRQYGTALGTAFQLADDLLDAEGDVSVVGKATGKDQDAGKATFVSLLGVDGARRRLDDMKQQAIAALAPFRPRDEMLVAAADFVVARKF